MHFGKLKELVRKLGGVLVLDGEEPEFVILSYHQYEKIEAGEEVRLSTNNNNSRMHNGSAGLPQVGSTKTNDMAGAVDDVDGRGVINEDEQEAVERLNQEISVLKEEIRLKEEAELVADEQSTEAVAETVDFN